MFQLYSSTFNTLQQLDRQDIINIKRAKLCYYEKKIIFQRGKDKFQKILNLSITLEFRLMINDSFILSEVIPNWDFENGSQ